MSMVVAVIPMEARKRVAEAIALDKGADTAAAKALVEALTRDDGHFLVRLSVVRTDLEELDDDDMNALRGMLTEKARANLAKASSKPARAKKPAAKRTAATAKRKAAKRS